MKLVLVLLTLVSVFSCRGHAKPPDSNKSSGAEPSRVHLPDLLPLADLTNTDTSNGKRDESIVRKDCVMLGGEYVKKGKSCPDHLTVDTTLWSNKKRCCLPESQTCPAVTSEPLLTTTVEATTQGPTTTSPVLEACSSKGGVLVGLECFIFSAEGDELSWEDAVESCWQKYGPLASPVDPGRLLDYVAANYMDIPMWVGGYSIPYEKSFEWINGKPIPSSQNNKFPWAPNEPTLPDEDRRCLQVNNAGGYAVEPCSNEQRYVCSLDACGMLGGVTIGYQCLAFKTEQLSWGVAEDACKAGGGRLAVAAYPQLLIDYVTQNNEPSESTVFWVGGLQTDFSNKDSWSWLNDEPIPLDPNLFPWAEGEPNNLGGEHCLDIIYYTGQTGYNDANCNHSHGFVCELKTSTTERPSPVQFVIRQSPSGNYIGPGKVFPNIQDNDPLSLHFTLDRNMHMTFDQVHGIWGYIRHVISGKILSPLDTDNATSPMNPPDGVRVVLRSERRPWALFAIDQYQNRIIHRSGKYISAQEKYIIISGDETDNKTMEFMFMNPNNPDDEVLPYGYPVISGQWQMVFTVDNPIATHTYSAKVTIGRSESHSSSHGFKYGFEIAKDTRTSTSTFSSSSSSSYSYSSGYSSHPDSGHSTSCTNLIFWIHCHGSGGGSSSGNSHGSGSASTSAAGSSSSSSLGTTTTNSISSEMHEASTDTWNSSKERDISFTVEAGKSVAVWQRIIILEHEGHKAVHLTNIFADTNSSRINPNNFNTHPLRFL